MPRTTSSSERVREIFAAILLLGLVTTGLWVRALGWDRGGLAAGVTMMGFVGASSPDRFALLAVGLALLVVEWWWARRGTLSIRLPWPRITEALNAFLVVLLVIQVGRAAALRLEARTLPVPATWSAVAGSTGGPNMYLILADGHGRSDVLRADYGYDMTGFADALTALDFSEATSSEANQSFTRFSLAVLLNGRPLSELGQDMTGPVDETLPFAALHDASAIELLKSAGYETTYVASGYEHLAVRGTDRYIDVGPRNEVEQAMLDGTALGRALDSLTGGQFAGVRTRTLTELSTLESLAAEHPAQPQFVFAHLPSPHVPDVFRADCSLRPTDVYTRGAIDRGYRAGDQVAVDAMRDQTICLDRLLQTTIQRIVEADPGAVIVLFSDHGPEERLDWLAPADPGAGDRMANLFWARTPGRQGLFPQDITLVNILPILFNGYLGTSLPLHPNDLFLGPTPNNDRFVPYTPVG